MKMGNCNMKTGNTCAGQKPVYESGHAKKAAACRV